MAFPTLQRARILDLMNESDIDGLSQLGDERTFASGEQVFRENEPPDSLYILLEGRVRSSLLERGQQIEIAKHNPGDHFGRAVLIEGQLCYTSAVGLAPGRVFVLSSLGCAALLARMSRGRPLIPKFTPAPNGIAVSGQGRSNFAAPSSGEDLIRIRSLSSAVAGVAHEINTPLGVIENAASFVSEQLSDGALVAASASEETREMLADVAEACRLIQKNVAHAAKLVQSFKKLSVGQLAEPRAQVDLVRVIHEVLNVFRAKTISALPPGPNYRGPRGKSGQHRLILASSRLDIGVSCDLPEAERIWDGFPGLFSRVLLNLLTNVDRYAYPGDAPGKVQITLERARLGKVSGFALAVQDFGQGVNESDLPHIFDPFFTTGRDKGGTGLGLAMVHNLVTQGFNGTVRARSLRGKGTTFELEFPERAPDHAAVLNQSLEPHHGMCRASES